MELPKAIVSEKVVLGTIILDFKNIVYLLDILKKDYFYLTKHVLIFEEILYLFRNNVEVDIKVLCQSFIKNKNIEEVGGVSYLSELTQEGTYKENLIYHANLIKDSYEKRRIINVCKIAIDESFKDKKKAMNIIRKCTENLYGIDGDKGYIYTMEEALNSTLKKIEGRYKNREKLIGCTTGIKEIDNAIYGLKKSEFVVLAARPSMGKTALVLNMISNASKENKVAIFSLEMSKEELSDRWLADQGTVALSKIKSGKLGEGEFEKLLNASCTLVDRNIIIYDGPALTVSEIKSKAVQLKMNGGLDVLVIDYLQLIEGNGQYKGNRVYEMSQITRELKNLAKELEINVLALAQLSRAADVRLDKRPIPSDLKDSGSIEQDADIVMFLYRAEYYYKKPEYKGLGEINIAKNRNGRTGTIKLLWKPEYQRFIDFGKVVR